MSLNAILVCICLSLYFGYLIGDGVEITSGNSSLAISMIWAVSYRFIARPGYSLRTMGGSFLADLALITFFFGNDLTVPQSSFFSKPLLVMDRLIEILFDSI